MDGGFARQIPGIKLFESGVDVVKVEYDGRLDPFVCVVLYDLKDIDLNRIGFAARGAKARENEAFAPGRNDCRRYIRQQPDVGRYPQVFHRRSSTMPDPGIHDSTTIVAVVIVGEQRSQRVPVAGREVCHEALCHS
ncbi:MAG TPA: hypothetical protein VLV86_09870, partial [Vicinamibacterales bacterium]|nr:hypothetical protein [Vicinamibacterales bacterium]